DGSADLFRARICWGEQPIRRLNRLLSRSSCFFQKSGYSEVEQLRRARDVDKNVGGLQIAVNDQMTVRIRDGFADTQEQDQAVAHRNPRGVNINGCPFDILHDEKRPAAIGVAGIYHVHDRRVVERCENPAFLKKTFAPSAATVAFVSEELYGNFLL